jgi:CRP-like cAMP-binding protein
MASASHPNGFLASLEARDRDILLPQLKPFELEHSHILFDAGQRPNSAYLPHSGAISLVVGLADGQLIEAAMIGRDSLVGGGAALDRGVTLNRAIVQVKGSGSIVDVDVLRDLAEQSVAFRTIVVRHQQAQFVQAQQSAACNASHTVEARLSRWLLRTRDATGSDTFGLTQEFLAQMLGVRRTSVSLVANTLQAAGLIRYRRGNIEITNLQGLRETSCECYQAVKTRNDRLLGDVTFRPDRANGNMQAGQAAD